MLILALILLQGGDVRARAVLQTGDGIGEIDLWISGLGGTSFTVNLRDSRPFHLSKSAPASWDEKKGLQMCWSDIPNGPRLALAAWRKRPASEGRDVPTHYVDGRWVRPGGPETTFHLEPSRCGDVEIEPAKGVAAAGVAFVPADVDGTIPAWSERPEGPAFYEPLREGKAVFKGMKPGRYVFYPAVDHPDRPAPVVTALVEVKAGETVRASLGR